MTRFPRICLTGIISVVVVSGSVLAAGPAAADGSGTVGDPWVPTRTAHETCSDGHLFGNYRNGDYLDAVAAVPQGDRLDIRYLTGGAAMAKWNGHGVWGFTKQSCIQFS